ncbi:hypothetical protein SIAM614_19816 [Stappia aggregata IAM 12614]|uniref:Uncharacterized protein n=1 Tax=Roseibium aggregatum (strain ATCC 25650 / DSM 13394 / JCM 20685 / NBRC 16684 / NCIMB 2208 / IAM 12614 / B1) TaxID=384765 RepID=A0NVU0_ROSAI|nr:hypothetical protein [Roseibium aggregatum]EAV43105.1 hypothetical protein SIAM614_19816 [Stappia aggregata IAM 12614] [Roseibium aggregatum IAM 12614]
MSKADPAYCRASAFAVGFRAKRIAKFHPFFSFDFSVQAFWPAQMYFDVSILLKRVDSGRGKFWD